MLGLAARHGRFVLVAGLLAGASLPGLAAKVLPLVPYFIGALLFLNAFRTGDQIWHSVTNSLRRTTMIVLGLQLGLPLAFLGTVNVTGIGLNGFTFAAVLMLAAPALTGAPNFVSMLGRDPTDAMRILVVGTLLFPLTALVVLWALPSINAHEALLATVRLAATILGVVILGAAARRALQARFSRVTLNLGCDDISAVLLFIVVIGLMAEIGPLLRTSPGTMILWIGGVLVLNLTLQFGGLSVFRNIGLNESLPAAVIAGNRNIALFLIALPQDIMQQAMLFIGCYQIPMYLTPIFLRWKIATIRK